MSPHQLLVVGQSNSTRVLVSITHLPIPAFSILVNALSNFTKSSSQLMQLLGEGEKAVVRLGVTWDLR
jgi:hypothetical protein